MSANKIYTRAGDDGTTSLLCSSGRVLKSHPQICAIGAIDELGAVLGVVHSLLTSSKSNQLESSFADLLIDTVSVIERDLFDIGAEIASHSSLKKDVESDRYESISDCSIKRLEDWCDSFSAELPKLLSFVLSGSCELSSWFHMARVFARRGEREIIAYEQSIPTPVRKEVIGYLNRVSDLFFILARLVVIKSGKSENIWTNPPSIASIAPQGMKVR